MDCARKGTWKQALHGCRQLVPWGVRLSPLTSANPCRYVTMSTRLPELIEEEGVDDVKSAWPLCLGLHTWYNGRYKGCNISNMEPICPDLSPDWGLQLALMKLELLVIVNQLCHGESVPRSCTHRPSNHGRCILEVLRVIRRSTVNTLTGVKS